MKSDKIFRHCFHFIKCLLSASRMVVVNINSDKQQPESIFLSIDAMIGIFLDIFYNFCDALSA